MDARKVIAVGLRGIRPIMFDRYPGDNQEQLAPEQRMYVVDGALVMPAVNISSFLSALNTESAPQRVGLGKKWKIVAKAALSFVDIDPLYIPFTRDGEVLTPENSGWWVDSRVARLPKGIPNPKRRPVLDVPWELAFKLTLFPNADLSENLLRRLFDEGGIAIGLGTFRGVYGKFVIDKWEHLEG